MMLGCRPPEPPAHEQIVNPAELERERARARERAVELLSRSAVSGGREVTCAERRAFEHEIQQLISMVEERLGWSGLSVDQVEVLDPVTFQQSAELWFARHHDMQELRAEGRMFWGMGLLHATFDYAEAVRELSLTGLMSFYDDEEKTVYLRHDDLSDPALRSALIIAFTHALVDHHLGFHTFLQPSLARGDERLARVALLEGVALTLWLDIVGEDPGGAMRARLPELERQLLEQQPMSRMPDFVQRLALFPHFAGARYVYALEASQDEEAKRAEFLTRAPRHTAAIIAPLAEPLEHQIVLAEMPYEHLGELDPREPEYESSLGVFGLQSWLELVGQRTDAEALTRGWRGDRVWSIKRGANHMLLLHVSVWASEEDAVAFRAAIEELFRLRYHRKRRYHTESLQEGQVVVWLEGLIGEDGSQERSLETMLRSVVIQDSTEPAAEL